MRLTALAGTLVVTAMAPHPLHTTLAVFSVRGDASAAISIRAFADDFGAAVRQHAGDRSATSALPSEAAIEAYTRSAVRLTTSAGRAVPLTWCGTRHEGDLVWICLEAPARTMSGSLRMRNALLFERFNDQVNIVQVIRDAHRATILFTKSDGAKALTD